MTTTSMRSAGHPEGAMVTLRRCRGQHTQTSRLARPSCQNEPTKYARPSRLSADPSTRVATRFRSSLDLTSPRREPNRRSDVDLSLTARSGSAPLCHFRDLGLAGHQHRLRGASVAGRPPSVPHAPPPRDRPILPGGDSPSPPAQTVSLDRTSYSGRSGPF